MAIQNETLAEYDFLTEMFADQYFPDFLVLKLVHVLEHLCEQIETHAPETDEELFELTRAATERINELNEEFWEHGSEIETAAREAIAADIMTILEEYGYDVDIEAAIDNRDW